MAAGRRCSATSGTLATPGAVAPNQHGGSPCRLLDLTFVRYRRSFLACLVPSISRRRAFFRVATSYRDITISGHFFIPLAQADERRFRRSLNSADPPDVVCCGSATAARVVSALGARVCGS